MLRLKSLMMNHLASVLHIMISLSRLQNQFLLLRWSMNGWKPRIVLQFKKCYMRSKRTTLLPEPVPVESANTIPVILPSQSLNILILVKWIRSFILIVFSWIWRSVMMGNMVLLKTSISLLTENCSILRIRLIWPVNFMLWDMQPAEAHELVSKVVRLSHLSSPAFPMTSLKNTASVRPMWNSLPLKMPVRWNDGQSWNHALNRVRSLQRRIRLKNVHW